MSQALPRRFYNRSPETVARELLGLRLLRRTRAGLVSGIIVEAEAYLAQDDSACHSSRGMTPRNEVMFGPPGHLYVYPIHARHCLNVVTEPAGVPSAILIRAIEPLDGIEHMQANRLRDKKHELTSGPAKLCEALAVDRTLNGCDLTTGQEIWLAEAEVPTDLHIKVSPRIGVTSNQCAQLRYYVEGNRYVSGPRSIRPGKQ